MLTGGEGIDPEPFLARLREAVNESGMLRTHTDGKLRRSYGVVCCEPERYASVDDLLAEADRSMYDRKPVRERC